MLTKPKHGWTIFNLQNTSNYGLSYMEDIAFSWVDQAITGLETNLPFCVKADLEPDRFLCLVSYKFCYIFVEKEGTDSLNYNMIGREVSKTSMVEFCTKLLEDITENIDLWVKFASKSETSVKKTKQVLRGKLDKLSQLLDQFSINYDKL